MPATKLRNRRALQDSSQQLNGLFVHSSPPKVLQINSKNIRQWIRSGDISQLEQIVLQGQGHKLIGEYSPDPKVRGFLKQIPQYLAKINELHKAVAKGDLKQLQKSADSKISDNLMKNIYASKNHAGVGLLHKAVYYGYPEIVDFLVKNYPQTINMKDKEGKTPLHYCGGSKKAGKIWPMLVKAGADQSALDSKNRYPAYYMERSNEVRIIEDKPSVKVSTSPTSDLIIKPSNIRIWIHDKDLNKLQQVIWEGHGSKLKVETSNNPRVRRFLEGLPHVLNVIKDVHYAVINDNFEDFVKKTSDPVPIEVLGSKDINGLTPLHKAVGLEHWNIANHILQRNPKLVSYVDNEGRTPLHYAAALKDNNGMFNMLKANNADEMAFDKNGKTPSYYRTNPKEINMKLLEVIPEAPRTSANLPQAWDWLLFRTESSAPSTLSSLPSDKENEIQYEIKPQQTSDTLPPKSPEIEVSVENGSISQENDKPNVDEKPIEIEGSPEIFDRNDETDVETQENYDIWTNDYDKESQPKDERDEKSGEDESYAKEEDSGIKDQTESDFDEKIEDEEEKEDGSDGKIQMTNSQESLDYLKMNGNAETKEKTEREIAEERQRMLDEGLIQINPEDEELSEEEKINEIIKNEDMEKLAQMVLNGEGNKLMGKTSDNLEIQTFLDSLPSYMNKITAVHKAARSGSLKDLQGALDRRRFAIAKETSDNLGATPLHVAILFGNTQIVKYLSGRFPETLQTKDKFGRTPLHYAAVLPDDQFYNELINLGADPQIKDDSGHTPEYYKNNPGELTQEKLKEELNAAGVSSPITDPIVRNGEPEIVFDEGIPLSKSKTNEDVDEGNGDDSSQSNYSPTDRDEYGQSILHFAAARAHGRGGLFQLIQESSVNLGYRDELYRTARDVAIQANISDNIYEIDRYVISLAARDEMEKLVQLYLEGYDHILDLEDDEDNNILTVATNKNHEKTLAFLKAIPSFEEKRERMHRAIRTGEEKLFQDILGETKNTRLIITGKNCMGRCSLHIAVLCQQKEITEFIAQKYPETLKIGDNLERTALHYAMGVNEVETLSKILIKCGAKRVLKDLKGRQPTYYFMNRTEILKLQEEENMLKV